MPRPENDIGFGPLMPPVRGALGLNRETDEFPQLSNLGLVSTPYTDGKGRTVSRVVATWDVTELTPVEQDNKRKFLTSYSVGGGFSAEAASENNTITIDNQPVEVDFHFRVRYRDVEGKTGVYLQGTVRTKADEVAPPQPTKPTLFATFKGVSVAWDGGFVAPGVRPSDFSYVEAECSTSEDFGSIQIAGRLGNQGQTAVQPVFANTTATKVYVRLRAYDRSGNASVPSEVASIDVLKKVPADIAKFSLTDQELADLTLTSRVISNDAIINEKIGPNAVRDRQLAAASVKAAKTDLDAIDPNSGKISIAAIDVLQLRARSVIAEKIEADEIVTRHLNAGTITFDEIAGNAVFAHHITSRAISSDKIATNAVIAGKIAAGAIVASSLSVASLSPDFVKNGSFEDDFDSWNINYENAGGSWFITSEAQGFSGKKCAIASNPGNGHCAMGSTTFPVKAEELWYLQCYAQAFGHVGTIYLRAVFYNQAGNYVGYHDVAANELVYGSIGLYDGQVTIPGGATQMQVVVYAYRSTNGQAWQMKCDDVSARRVTLSAHIGEGEIKAPLIKSENVQSLHVQTNTLGALQIGGGAITSDELFSTAVTGKLITGGTFQTGAEGDRIIITDAFDPASGRTFRDAIRWIRGDTGSIVGDLRGYSGETGRYLLHINSTVQLGNRQSRILQVGQREISNGIASKKSSIRADFHFYYVNDQGRSPGRIRIPFGPGGDGSYGGTGGFEGGEPKVIIATVGGASIQAGEALHLELVAKSNNAFEMVPRVLSNDPNRNLRVMGDGGFVYLAWYAEQMP